MIVTAPPPKATEKTVLVGLEHDGVTRWDLEDSLTELRELAATAGATVVDTVTQKLQHPTAPYYIGKGKAEEVATRCSEHGAGSIIFDDELSPAQGRNLESVTSKKVLDRTQLILAQLQDLLPRLTRMWTHLSRQTGGIGTRGPGETQLEVDRRRVQERISRLQRELEEVRKHRTIQREGRARHQWPVVAIVGYTNAGKSSLLNRLTKAGVLAEDKLFATLDPTTRQFVLPNKLKVLFTDTVGFIRKLPHTVIESFKATLEELKSADLLVHVVDVSHPQWEEHIAATEGVIRELQADGKHTLIVFNKIDRVPNPEAVEAALARYPGSVAVSVKTGENLEDFVDELQNQLAAWRLRQKFRIPQSDSAALAELHRAGHVVEIAYQGDDALVTAHIPPALEPKFARYAV
jgi:GTP-binding protein HflX